MGCSVGHTWVSYPGLSLIGSLGPFTPLELQESSRWALLWGPSAPPYTLPRLHQGPDSSPLGWTSVEPSGNVGAARKFWFLQSLRSQLRWKMDWLLGDGGAWASPCGLSRKGKCGQAGNRFSEVGGRPVGEDCLSSAVPEPQHSRHCCPLSRSHIDTLVTQVSI